MHDTHHRQTTALTVVAMRSGVRPPHRDNGCTRMQAHRIRQSPAAADSRPLNSPNLHKHNHNILVGCERASASYSAHGNYAHGANATDAPPHVTINVCQFDTRQAHQKQAHARVLNRPNSYVCLYVICNKLPFMMCTQSRQQSGGRLSRHIIGRAQVRLANRIRDYYYEIACHTMSLSVCVCVCVCACCDSV